MKDGNAHRFSLSLGTILNSPSSSLYLQGRVLNPFLLFFAFVHELGKNGYLEKMILIIVSAIVTIHQTSAAS
jgi:hypothetical protein